MLPFRPSDEVACRDLLRQVFGPDVASLSYYRLAPRRAFIATDRNRVMGLASSWENPMHPMALRCGVVVGPSHRGLGLGTRLWNALMETEAQGRSLVTGLWETQGTGHQFALRHGFEEMRRTYTTRLGLDGVDAAGVFSHWSHGLESQGFHLSRYPDTSARIRTQMVAVLQEVYTNTHRANPVRPVSRDEWRALAFSEDLLPWGSVAVLHKNQCVAAALLHKSAEGGLVDLGWRGVTGFHQGHSRALILLMTAHQILAAATRGYRTMSLECDSTDPWSRDVLESFPFEPAPAWITLRRT